MSVLNRILKTKQEEVTERKNRISERDLMSTLLAGRQRLSMRKALEESATGIIDGYGLFRRIVIGSRYGQEGFGYSLIA